MDVCRRGQRLIGAEARPSGDAGARDGAPAPHPVRFAVASVGRSGSTLLERLLDSHPHAVCRGELLGSESNLGREQGPDTIAAYLRETLLDPASRLPGVRAVGFRAMWEHGIDHPALWDVLEDFGFRLVLNSRPNKLDQFLSMRLAQITGDWSSMLPYEPARFAVDPATFDAYVDGWQAADAGVLALAERFPAVAVTYDEVRRGDRLDEVQRHLGLDAVVLRTNTVRARRRPRAEVVTNWEEVVAHLRGTPREPWLSDDDSASGYGG